MGLISKSLGRIAAPLARTAAPKFASGFIRSILDRAIDGVGPLPGAALSADRALIDAAGDRDKAVKGMIDSHVRLAGAQGFATNIGGLVTAVAAIPANIAGLALVQCHLIAGIAHLRGYELADLRVRNAVLACMVGQDGLDGLVKSGRLPHGPRDLATAETSDPATDDLISTVVTAELVAQIGGKRMATMVGRRIPLLGGAVGATADGFATWQIGRFAANSLPPRDLPDITVTA